MSNEQRASGSVTRRRFVTRSAVAGAAILAGHSPASATNDKPAVLGGRPACTRTWPAWPVADASDADALQAVLRSGRWYRYAGGDSTVSRFEQLWADDTGARHCLAVSSGTAALITSLAALEIGPGDEVLIPPYTFIATVNSVLMHHALPVFVDSDPATAQIDVADVEARITDATRCIVPVHLGGASCDMEQLMALARRRQIHVVEDSCQTHTGQWNGQRLGTFGDAGCFSFQNSKNLTSGEGGALLTSHDWLYHRAHAFHNNGNGPSHDGGFTGGGGNFRLTPMQGALLIAQHQRLDQQSRKREANAAHLDALLGEIEGVAPKRKLPGTTRHGYHLYVFDYDPAAFAEMPKQRFLAALQAEGVPASGGYSATNRMPWVQRVLQSRGFQRIYGQQRLERWVKETEQLPANDRLIETACWLGQNVLLSEKADLERIAEAVRRIQKHAAAIVAS